MRGGGGEGQGRFLVLSSVPSVFEGGGEGGDTNAISGADHTEFESFERNAGRK